MAKDILWRNYDKAGLDAQFTLDTIVDLPGEQKRRLDAAAAARAAHRHVRRVPYGPGPEAKMDIFYHDTGKPGPIHMFIHGGFWMGMDATTFSFAAAAFVPFGATVAVIDYPVIPNVRMGDIFEHVKQAIAFLFKHGAEHGGDPNRIFVAGHSAGAHMLALAMDPTWQAAAGLPADVVKGGCAISGVYELTPLTLSFQRDPLGLTAEEVAKFSPLRHLPKSAGPLIMTVGGFETQEFVDQTLEYARAWRGAGLKEETIVVAQANHISILTDGYARHGAALHGAVLRQMGIGG